MSSTFTGYAQQTPNQILENLGSEINSVFDEMNPIVSADGKTLFFCRSNHPENIGGKKDNGDIWYSVKNEEGHWQLPLNLGAPLNNALKNDMAGVSPDGNRIYLHHIYSEDGKSQKPGISFSSKTQSGWTSPEKLDVPYFYNASNHQSAFITKDENVLIMSLESYGTFGAEDLYVSFKLPSGNWTEAMNLGSVINTPNQELAPFLAEDNVTLFFISNGRKGLGSKDIYKTKRLDETWKNWSDPENLGPTVNSEGMELFYFQDPLAEYTYIVSTKNSNGYSDIHRMKIRNEDQPAPEIASLTSAQISYVEEYEDPLFQEPDTVIVFKFDSEPVNIEEEVEEAVEVVESKIEKNLVIEGKIFNKQSQKGIEANIFVENDLEGKATYTSSKPGNFEVKCSNPGIYNIVVSAKGYMPHEEVLELKLGTERLKMDFALIPLEVGTTIQLNDVLFEQGTSDMTASSSVQLDKVVNMMKENPSLIIDLAGYTDNQGLARLNIKLSQDRVEKVKQYILERGIEENRITGKGYGGIKPIASNKSEETRKLNRRVEFTIVKN